VPNLPSFYRDAWKPLGLDSTVVNALLASRMQAELVQRIFDKAGESAARRVALWLLLAISEDTDDTSEVIEEVAAITDEQFIELAAMVDANELSSTAAKEVFFEMQRSSENPKAIAQRKNLIQVSDEGAIAQIVDEVLADPANTKAVSDIKNGNDKVIGFLVGQVMKKSQGKANPALAQKLIRERL